VRSWSGDLLSDLLSDLLCEPGDLLLEESHEDGSRAACNGTRVAVSGGMVDRVDVGWHLTLVAWTKEGVDAQLLGHHTLLLRPSDVDAASHSGPRARGSHREREVLRSQLRDCRQLGIYVSKFNSNHKNAASLGSFTNFIYLFRHV
jgi:hypothetical protein